MLRTCPKCGVPAESDARFCAECGDALPAQPELVLEVETGRPHVQNHACQLRFRVTNPTGAESVVALRMVLHGGGRYVEQDELQIEQVGEFQDEFRQHVLSFPFRPLIPGEIPIETLRMVVGPAGNLKECRVLELPDRSLFVRAADPNQPSPGPGIVISGGIHVDLSEQEVYGSELKGLMNLNVDQSASTEAAETNWQAIRLRPAGTEQRIRCTFAGCARPVALRESCTCTRCHAVFCRRHQDADEPACCRVCAEQARSDEFRRKSQQITTPTGAAQIIETLLGVRQSRPAFEGRIWTEPATRPVTRDISTVARQSKACHAVGQKFTLNAQADRDCHLTVLDIGTSGKVYLLLKNHPLRAGGPISVSGPDAARQWIVGGPPGVERIKAFFTIDPLALFPGTESFTPLESSGRPGEAVARIREAGVLLEQMPDHSWTDASCEFVVSD